MPLGLRVGEVNLKDSSDQSNKIESKSMQSFSGPVRSAWPILESHPLAFPNFPWPSPCPLRGCARCIVIAGS